MERILKRTSNNTSPASFQLPLLFNRSHDEISPYSESTPTSPISPTSPTPLYKNKIQEQRKQIKLKLLYEFLKTKTEPDYCTSVALHEAYSCENFSAAELLLHHELVDPNCRSKMGLTPLLHLANKAPFSTDSRAYISHIPQLIANGADCLLRGPNGNTALMYAVARNNTFLVAGLLGTYKNTRTKMLHEMQQQKKNHALLKKMLKNSTPDQQKIFRAKINSEIHTQLKAKNTKETTVVTQAITAEFQNEQVLAEITKCLSYDEILQAINYAHKLDLAKHGYSNKHSQKLIEALKLHPSVLKEAKQAENTTLVELLSQPKMINTWSIADFEGT